MFFLTMAGIPQSLPVSRLHVEGPFLKNSSGQTVILRGINHHGFLDVPDGAWDPPGAPLYSGMGSWNPGVVRQELRRYHQMGFNVVRFHTIVDWWKSNPQSYQDPYRKVAYPESYREMIEDTVKWAGEQGLYVIFDFFALKNIEGRQSGQESLPWPPEGRFPDVVKDKAEFETIWESVSQTLGHYPNVLFELYNEPHGDAGAEEDWFQFVKEVLPKIRVYSSNPIIVQWDYMCWVNLDYPPPAYRAGRLDWIEKHPLDDPNIVYGTHLYRNSGNGGPGTAHRSGPPLVNLWDESDIKQALTLALIPYVTQKIRKPLLVTEVGAYLANGSEDKAHELLWLKNSLAILNEWGIGYVGWGWASDNQINHGMLHDGEPNAAGEIFLDSISKHLP
jgi:aryl-phospho-beta-D-glucosidase BglC (GH1 family)